MKDILFTLIFLFSLTSLFAQQTITGQVLDPKGKPVSLANVYLQDIYDGGVTDEAGNFSFETQATGTVLIVVSHVEFEKKEQSLDMAQVPSSLVINLKKGGLRVSPVVITAGSFEASDEKKGTILKPLDIVTNAGAAGDLFGAIQTLPGVSPTANETGIFVRGGGAYETRTLIDGTIAPNPFFADVPNIPSRGRFDPFLFKGTLFSTGGYSAEYGQALSSVLLLNTQDMPQRTSSGIGINLAGINASHTKLWNGKSALLASGGISYLDPYFSLINANRDWQKAPRGYNISLGGRHKVKGGMYKTYLQHQAGNLQLGLENLEDPSS
ncbi:MAG: carboxypeptidase-like regulatory domain-containing protein, partial [Bacteroidota bacterium]